jgi:uncharacterized protein (TIGR02996 family)
MSDRDALLAAVLAAADDDAPRLVFADWLDERGDSRGEFVRVQCALARLPADDPRRAELERREHDLLTAHQAAWAEPLRGLASDWTYRRGFIESVAVDASAFVARGAELFRRGPVRRVRFLDAGRCIARLVESPLLARVREIDLCGNFLGNGGVAQLARARDLDGLEVLHLGFNDLTDQALKALAAMPQLARLRELYLDDNRQLGTPGLRALADSPHLGELRLLDLGGNNLIETALKVLVNGESLEKLDALVLTGNQIGDGGAEALARAPLLQRMLARAPRLNLARNNIGPVGARALAESPAVATLEELDLDINAIGDTGLAALAQSPHLNRLRRLSIRENRVGDAGVVALARSRLAETLEAIDLTGNFVTTESIRALDEAVIALDWRRKIQIRHDPGLHQRAPRLAR